MGQAKLRGTFEQRKEQAIEAGRVKVKPDPMWLRKRKLLKEIPYPLPKELEDIFWLIAK